jgi:hypothetical protein
MTRFDERRLKKSDDGDDFRDFVGEILRASPGFGRPIPRDSGSVDGGIDLYCEQEALVVECKFIGANVKDTSARVDQEWKNVHDKLDKTLITRDGKAEPTRAPYKPWADAAHPIKRYVFATSAQLANEQAQRDLTETIQSFFYDNIATRPGYEHLGKIKIEIIDWTNIETRLADHPSLVFKWLKQWPSGFSELDDRKPSGFRAFLHSDRLPYLARDSWQAPGGLRHPWTETSLVEELDQAEVRDPVVVLIGQGGVGKTRLGLECGRRMRALGWWTVHCDGLRASTAGLRQILEESCNSKRLLLFVDYLETWPGFEAFANDVLDINETSGHQVRVIATCRASYRDRLPSFIKLKNVGGKAAIEVSYSKAVTQHILSEIKTADTVTLAEKCRHNFALAAFLLFLRQERPEAFAAEISALRDEPSFEAWIIKRLQNAGLRGNLNVVAAILVACEFPVATFDELAKVHGGLADDLRRVLVADKWIERREAAERGAAGPVWAVFHDVFTDVVLARALEAAPDRDDAINRLLERAVVNGVFRQTLSALERLKQIEALSTVDWRSHLLELELRRPRTLASHARLLLANALLSPKTRLDLIAVDDDLREAIAVDPACAVGIALTAVTLSESDIKHEEFDRVILPLLDIAVARAHHSNMLLRLGFNTRPDRYREAVLQWIDAHPRAFQTHFLLKVWLDQAVGAIRLGSPVGTSYVDAVRGTVNDWLAAFPASIHASFVLAPWLDAAAAIGGERVDAMVTSIETHVAAWLAHGDHAIRDDARFVYKSWLDATVTIGGERAATMVTSIETQVAAWLAHGDHAIIDNAQFVYQSWLDGAATIGGERAATMVTSIETQVAAWLAHGDHAIRDDAQFVYKSWLDAAAAIGGERAAAMVASIETHVAAWLAHGDYAIRGDARFVYKSWLDATVTIGGERAATMVASIETQVAAWLAHGDHAIIANAQFVYQSWLDGAATIGGERAAAMVASIETHLFAWLAHGDHAIRDDAQFVYKSWLDAAAAIGGERAAAMVASIETHVAAWLAHGDNAISDDAKFVYKSWLEAADEGRLRRFFDETLVWILTHQDDDKCDFVLESWLDKHLDFHLIAEPCFRAVRRLHDDARGAFILKHVVRQKNLPEDVIFAALCWCARFPDHADALNRLGPLLNAAPMGRIDIKQMIRVAARVLYYQNIVSLIADPFKVAAARATLGSLNSISPTYPLAEKLARIYFIRWLRDGRVFRPESPLAAGTKPAPHFDQRVSLVESLLTLMAHGEFQPAINSEDETNLAQFCDWVGQWETSNLKGIDGLVDELTDRFGLPDLWQRMLPEGRINLDSTRDQSDMTSVLDQTSKLISPTDIWIFADK